MSAPMTESMQGEKGWTRVAFGDVVRKVSDRVDPKAADLERYIAGEHMDSDDDRIRRWGLIGNDYLGPAFHMRFKPGQVLYGSRRTYLRKVAVPDFEGVTANTTFVLESKDPNALLPELLAFIMQTESFHEHSIKQSKGSVNPYVNFSDLAWYEFSLPPLEEQRRLARVLLSIGESIDKLGGLAETLARTERAAFDVMVDAANAPAVKMGDLLLAPPRNGYSPTERSEPTGHWVLALSAITPSGYQPGELKPVDPAPEVLATRLQRGDLVVSRSNTLDLVGLPAVFEEDRVDVSRPDTMMLLSPDQGKVTSRFLEMFLRSPRGRQQVQSYAAGTSASMKKINGSNLQKVLVPVPKLEDQGKVEESTGAVRICRQRTIQRLEETLRMKARFLAETIG